MSYSPDNPGVPEEDDLPLTADVDAHPMRLAPEIADRLTPGEQATFFCTLVDSAVDAIIAHRADGQIVWANQGALELLDYDYEELMALQPYGWVAPHQMRRAPRRIETILRTGKMTFESEVRRKDGTLVETEVSTRRVDTTLGPVVIAVVRDISEWVKSKRALEHLAYHDALTGLANRAQLDERLAVAIADAQRFGDILGMGYLDLDEFKPINDRFGHDVGDDVLIEVGRRLKEEVRIQDTVARIGGDEFVMILPRLATSDELGLVAERLVARIQEPIVALGHTVQITATVGLARFDAEHDDARSLLVKADQAMYAAKKDPEKPWMLFYDGMPSSEGRLDK
jgi:diguanylate cyclase (GGDEF)-like protein/PAS domain S-box-containing protein